MTLSISRAPENIVEKYWKKIIESPQAKNPAWDNDGAKDEQFNNEINDAQFFYLSFLAKSGSVIRTCTAPSGRKIFVPASCAEFSEYEVPLASRNERQLKSLARSDQRDSMVNVSVELDGESIPNLDDYLVDDIGPFNVTFPLANGIFTGDGPRNCQAVASGRYLVIGSLPPGDHKLHFRNVINSPRESHSEDIIYNLKIV